MKYLVILCCAMVAVAECRVSVANPSARIINGYNATNTMFPWYVSIRGTLVTGGSTLCGGAMISSQYILTAAHCLVGLARAQIGMGSNRLNDSLVSTYSTNFTIHPQYNPNTLANDIGIIRLPANISADNYIVTIRLPARNQENVTFANYQGRVTGFGRLTDNGTYTNNLQYANVTVITNAVCAQTYGSAYITNTTLCTLGREYNMQGPCAYDNGGPLSIMEGNNNTIIGVISFFSSQGCAAGHPVGYVRTASYLTWINQVTGIPIRAS